MTPRYEPPTSNVPEGPGQWSGPGVVGGQYGAGDPYGPYGTGGPYGPSGSGGGPYAPQGPGGPYGPHGAGDPYAPHSAGDPYGTTYPYGPGSPYGPGGYGGGPYGQHGPNRPRHRFGRNLLIVAVVAAALGAFVGLRASGSSPGKALTTQQVVAKIDPGVVDIVTTLGFQQAQAAGTGIVLTSSGEVLTNNHVIQGATSITARDVGNGRTYRARVVGYDRGHDIAVLQLRGASGLPTVTLGDSSSASVGQKVVALGNAGGRNGDPSVVTGKIAGLDASITAADQSAGTTETLHGLIRHDAAIQPGDSGGPLVSTTGQVIGIDTAASSGDFQFSSQTQTQAFAIPINEAKSIASQIAARTGSATVHIGATGFLGVEVLSADQAAANGIPVGSGAAIAGTLSGSPAEQLGMAAGDVIVSINGHRVKSPTGLQSVLLPHHPGDHLRIRWTDQQGQTHSGTLTLVVGPAG